MTLRATQVTVGAEKVVRKAALAADAALVLSTPVDTGRARGGWLAAVDSIALETVPKLDKSGTEALAQAREVISQWRLGDGTIFLSNSVPYIVPLEEGHSKQAPQGMTRHGIAAARAELRAAKLLKE